MNQSVVPAIFWLFIFIVIAGPSPARAEALPLACQASIGQAHPASGALELSGFDAAPEGCLKTMFMHCSAASEKEVLEMGAVMMCSVAYEALLRRVFRGEFESLLAWWQTERGNVVALPGTISAPANAESPMQRRR